MRAHKFWIVGMSGAIIVVGCLERSGSAVPTSPATGATRAAPIARTAAYSARKDSVGEVSGRVVLQPGLDGKALVVAVDVAPNDGDVDRVFVLQSEVPLGATRTVYDGAVVSYTPTAVVVSIPAESRRYLLRLTGARGDVSSAAATSRTTTLSGFGLTRRPGWFSLGNGVISPSDLEQIITLSCGESVTATSPRAGKVRPLNLPVCQSGGVGSISCEISCDPDYGGATSCYTSCANGYFACCNCMMSGATCGCRRNP